MGSNSGFSEGKKLLIANDVASGVPSKTVTPDAVGRHGTGQLDPARAPRAKVKSLIRPLEQVDPGTAAIEHAVVHGVDLVLGLFRGFTPISAENAVAVSPAG